MGKIKDSRKKHGKIFIFLFLAVFFLPSFVEPQTYQSFRSEREQIIKDTWLKFGPFRLSPRIRLRNIGYDDNVYYQREEDEPVSDYTATISPEIRVNVLFRNSFIFYLKENPEYVYYVSEERERRWNNVFNPGIKFLLFNRFVLEGQYSRSSRRWRATSEFDVRANENREGYKGSFFYETARETSLGVNYKEEQISFDDITLQGEVINLSRLLDRREKTAGVEFYYRVFSRSFFFLKFEAGEYRFEHEESRFRDSDSLELSGGFRFPEAGRVQGLFSLGFKKLAPLEKGKKSFSGPIGRINLEYRTWRLVFRTQLERNNYFSYWSESIYFIENSIQPGISFYISRNLRLDYSFNYGEALYPEEIRAGIAGGELDTLKRRDIYRTHTAGLVVRLVRNIGLAFQVINWERDSNYFPAGRNRTFIGGYLTYEF